MPRTHGSQGVLLHLTGTAPSERGVRRPGSNRQEIAAISSTESCPACGTQLTEAAWAEGICPACRTIVSGEEPVSRSAEITGDEEMPTLDSPVGFLSPGQTLGSRYRIRSQLGRGGMGEVWRAFDLKLRVDVAVKALLEELLERRKLVEALRQEVRAAREVISPNVCRVFDLLELDGRELVSMEYIDGTTLAEVLSSRSPLELEETREIALQFLAGLEAIHKAGLVHRDIKPENVMITRSGRVVVMDFGLAKVLETAGTGTVAGTPAYMAPEQQLGEAVDSRADVFSAGVMLAEMIAPDGIRDCEARQAVWRGVRKEPPRLPESPWQAVLERAVARDPAQRFASAAELTRALEEVAVRVDGAEDVTPYPGLAAFGEEDAEYFFGRELEVEEVWKKLRRPHLLALIGQSGAGKSSFLRAGLLASRPEDWGHVICAPGSAPFAALREALVTEVSGDTEAMRELVRGEDLDALVSAASRWRQRHKEVLVILDQFEELFTLNPPDIQTRFSELLGRLALEADVHVLVSMRDDFLFHCSDQPALAPIFSELTLLRSPTGSALRRALVEPALNCGYRFEDEGLVDEMVAEVSEERGALPLVAFAAAALWSRRDREAGLLTRQAYEAIGGVGGALAQHAETTLERIGGERVPVVRELFRNLVTAQGTRTARQREELLSVFAEGERQDAAEILDTLVDARLLTSYELPAAEDEQPDSRHRIEIIHESLLSAWPRLVRWQTQDADSVQLRDQLRQAAQTWAERDHSDDLLWSGTAFDEFQLWQERYPGGLSEVEESFARAMTSLATRRKKLRRVAMAVVLLFLAGFGAVVSMFWHRSDAALVRAEASRLQALGRLELDSTPTGALAYGLASLELADDPETRRFVLETLWRGPTALTAEGQPAMAWDVEFSPDGRWLAAVLLNGNIAFWSETGGEVRLLGGPEHKMGQLRFAPESGLLAAVCDSHGSIHFWSIPEGTLQRSVTFGSHQLATEYALWAEGLLDWTFSADGRSLLTVLEDEPPDGDADFLVQSWPIAGGPPTFLGRFEKREFYSIFPGWFTYAEGGSIYVRRLDAATTPPARLLGRHDSRICRLWLSPDGQQLASGDVSGEVRLWSLTSEAGPPPRILRGHGDRILGLAFDPTARLLASSSSDGTTRVWDLWGSPEADPLLLQWVGQISDVTFHPTGQWLATAWRDVVVWPLGRAYARVLRGHSASVWGLAFAPDGSWIASSSGDGTIRQWPLAEAEAGASRVLFERANGALGLDVDAAGRFLLAGRSGSGVGTQLLPLVEGEPRLLEGFETQAWHVALSADGRFAAAGGGQFDQREGLIRVWDLETGEDRVLDHGGERKWIADLDFTPQGRLVSGGWGAVRMWNLAEDTFEILRQGKEGKKTFFRLGMSADGRFLASMANGRELTVQDLKTGESWLISSHGSPSKLALDAAGTTLVSADRSGQLRAGPATGEEPHLLVGHEGYVHFVAVSPDARWIASAGDDATVRLWPMPEGRPFHTLPLDQFVERLRALTSYRVVKDERAPSGYRLHRGPFPGWQTVPTW